MKKFLSTIMAALLLAGILPVSAAQTDTAQYDELWAQANERYMSGDFESAAELYYQIIDSGLFSAELYYNFANACFRTGQNTKAILYYNRALLLAPEDEDIRHNLAIAESFTKDSIEEVPEFILNRWARSLRNSLGEGAWTAISLLLLAAAIALGLVFLLSLRMAARKGAFFGMLATLLLFAAATSFAVSQRKAILDRRQAIVMSTAAPVKSSPDRAATDLFVLHEGTKVRITANLDRWSEIVIADGKKGWIESDKIEQI